MQRALAPQPPDPVASHNLLGQRLGRKGQETRERIMAAALRLLDIPQQGPVTLAAVAREAAVGMPALYVYFPDFGDLVLAVLRRTMASAETAFVESLRGRWPDGSLEESCVKFLRAHYRFWRRHARILHLRNSLADASDRRFLDYRNSATGPLIELLVRQMTADSDDERCRMTAIVLLTGFERLATVVTNPLFHNVLADGRVADERAYIDRLLRAEATIVALAIRAGRDADGTRVVGSSERPQ